MSFGLGEMAKRMAEAYRQAAPALETQFQRELAAAAERKKPVYELGPPSPVALPPLPPEADPPNFVRVPFAFRYGAPVLPPAFRIYLGDGSDPPRLLPPGYGYCVTCGFETPVDAVGKREGQGYCAKHLHTFDRYVGIKLDGVWEERCVTCGGPPKLTECEPDPHWRERFETALAREFVSDPRHHHGRRPPPPPEPLTYQPLWSRVLVCPLFTP